MSRSRISASPVLDLETARLRARLRQLSGVLTGLAKDAAVARREAARLAAENTQLRRQLASLVTSGQRPTSPV